MKLEQELKLKLSRHSYDRILKTLSRKIKKRVHQKNYYFDTPKLELRRNKISLRLRIEKQALLTLKTPVKLQRPRPGFKVRKEWETQIPKLQALKVIARKAPLESIFPTSFKKRIPLPLERIRGLGQSQNLRTYVALPAQGLELEIDRTTALGTTFYELEVETAKPKQAYVTIHKLFEDLRIPFVPENRSKLSRFLSLWRKKKGDR